MKKIYMIPTTQVVKIQTTKMIAVSLYGEDAQGEGMSRRRGRSIWDDDDDNDYDE